MRAVKPATPSTNRTEEQAAAIRTTKEFMQRLQKDGRDDFSIYVKVKIQNRDILFLVDTGCTHTMISHKWANTHGMMEQRENRQLSYAMAANGSRLACYGELKTKIQLSSQEFSTQLLISDIMEDGILGMDVIKNHQIEINIPQMTLGIIKTIVPLCDRKGRRFASQRQEDTTLPPYSKTTVSIYKHETIDKEDMDEPTSTQQYNQPRFSACSCHTQEDDNPCDKAASNSDRPFNMIHSRSVVCQVIRTSMQDLKQTAPVRNIYHKKLEHVHRYHVELESKQTANTNDERRILNERKLKTYQTSSSTDYDKKQFNLRQPNRQRFRRETLTQ